MLISLLIASIHERAGQLAALVGELDRQALASGRPRDAEVCTYVDARGAASIGRKRNELMAAASGEYMCFIDDDDRVSPKYLQHLLAAADSGLDCASLRGSMVTSAGPRAFIHAIEYTTLFERGGVYYRPPNHLNLVRRELVRDIAFQEINHGEDSKWALAVVAAGRLRTQHRIDDVIYLYTPSAYTRDRKADLVGNTRERRAARGPARLR